MPEQADPNIHPKEEQRNRRKRDSCAAVGTPAVGIDRFWRRPVANDRNLALDVFRQCWIRQGGSILIAHMQSGIGPAG
jgi:hypothetical protein